MNRDICRTPTIDKIGEADDKKLLRQQIVTKDQTAVRVVSRIAGNVVNAKALKKLTSIP